MKAIIEQTWRKESGECIFTNWKWFNVVYAVEKYMLIDKFCISRFTFFFLFIYGYELHYETFILYNILTKGHWYFSSLKHIVLEIIEREKALAVY